MVSPVKLLIIDTVHENSLDNYRFVVDEKEFKELLVRALNIWKDIPLNILRLSDYINPIK